MKRLLLLILLISPAIFAYSQISSKQDWLKYYNFSSQDFNNPSLSFAPFTRWWWPGNDVVEEELKREIKMFAENHFGGVEIQPIALVFPTKGKGRADRITSYDTPLYYKNLFSVFEEARKYGLTVDMTNGSGWPSGGPHLSEEDNNLTLEYGIIDIPKGNTSTLKIPRAVRGDRPRAKLMALLAVRVIKDIDDENKTIHLDSKNIINITSEVKDSTFIFTPSDNSWKAIAFWSMADMERPMLIAKKNAGFAVNHFDSTKIVKNYDYFFGSRTAMESYFGNPMRAIFNDSYEFRADRHFSDDFIPLFRKNRGYDITPYLPVNIWIGYNNMYERIADPNIKPSFTFDDQDWRIRYDYDLTLSDILRTHFLKASRNWSEPKGLLHRTQTYGPNLDIMAAAGDASIPEVETMQFNKGSEGAYKLISSGAHLYNRPIVSCEAAVYINRAFMTTPQKLKLTIDKILSCGVNQIIWHGTPYKYFPEGYPKEGWYPFYNATLGVNFSTDLNENNPFWKYISSINQYTQRAQYILRSGKPQADVLIYYPFLNYSEEAYNPSEILLNGYMKDVEPPLPAENETASFNRKIDTEWLNKVWPLINELNARGITWDWVNDASIQEMTVENMQLNIRGNHYKGIVLFDLPYIQLKSAQQLVKLSKSGANILTVGDLPKIQPSYFDYKINDELTAQAIAEVAKSSSGLYIKDIGLIDNWCNKLDIPLRNKEKSGFIRQIRRVMDDGSIAQFYWNANEQWNKASIILDKKYKYVYWMDAENGTITKADTQSKNMAEYKLPPYGTIFLYASTKPLKNINSTPKILFDPNRAQKIATIDQWNIQVDSVNIDNAALFNWKANHQLKYSSSEGVYTSMLAINKLQDDKKYYLDLGKVYYSADLTINDKAVGSTIYTPFVFDITSHLKNGNNNIKITITLTRYNEFVGEANNGNKLYKTFKDSELMSAGLIGPVIIYQQNKE